MAKTDIEDEAKAEKPMVAETKSKGRKKLTLGLSGKKKAAEAADEPERKAASTASAEITPAGYRQAPDIRPKFAYNRGAGKPSRQEYSFDITVKSKRKSKPEVQVADDGQSVNIPALQQEAKSLETPTTEELAKGDSAQQESAETVKPDEMSEADQASQFEELRRKAQKEAESLKRAQLEIEQKKQQAKKRSEVARQQRGSRKPPPARKSTHRQRGRRRQDDVFLDKSPEGVFGSDSGHKGSRTKEQAIFTPSSQNKGGSFERPAEFVSKTIEVPESTTIGNLARLMSVKAGDLIRLLLGMGIIKTINDVIDQETAVLVVEEMGHSARPLDTRTVEEEHDMEQLLPVEGGESRAAVVTVMGHVDHGKTSLLDYIRQSKVASGEAGGITQHIGAYHVETRHGNLTFLDTPGHADFVAMRARGARITDLIVLVVAANDSVMPQTLEAIEHARHANVPVVVAVSKMDLEDANMERVKSDLASHKLVPEDWGGQTQCIPVSTVTGEGVEELLESIALQAELLELKAVADVAGRGYVIESRLDKGGGPVATLLVNNGTLKVGDIVITGLCYGRIRAMINEHRQRVDNARASMPVEVLGLNEVPETGDTFTVVANTRTARELVEFRQQKVNEKRLSHQKTSGLDVFQQLTDSGQSTLNLIIKTDVNGSLEATEQAVQKIDSTEVKANIVASGVGGITESEALFAQTSNAILLGFNVRADAAAKRVIEEYSLDVRYYSVIYEMVDDVKALLSGMLAPELSEEIMGTAEVRNVFNSQRYGLIAGCLVTTGSVYRKKPIRVLRDNVVIYEGELESLRRIKDDVEEVKSGTECGIGVKNYKDVRIGDVIETFNVREIARSL